MNLFTPFTHFLSVFLGAGVFSALRGRVALPLRHASGRNPATSPNAARHTTALLGLFILILVPAAQAAPVPRGDLAPPDARLALEAFQEVERLVRAWKPGDNSRPDPASPLALAATESGAVQVTLRFGGRVVGRAWKPGGGDAALLDAARAAMQAAEPFLHQSELKEDAFASRLFISVEFAGALVPYAPASYDDADLEIPPGIDGVGARVGDTVRLIFPSTMLAHAGASGAGQSPGDALGSAAAAALDDPVVGLRAVPNNHPATLSKDRAVQFYRFEVSHVSQISPGSDPVFLYRHARVITEREVTLQAIESWAEGLTEHLAARIITASPKSEHAGDRAVHISPGSIAIEAMLHPVRGDATQSSDPTTMALVAYALAQRRPQIAQKMLVALSSAHEEHARGRQAAPRPAAAGAYLLALDRLAAANGQWLQGTDHATTRAIEACVKGYKDPDVALAERALALAGLARRARTDQALRPRLDGAMTTLLTSAGIDQLASAMPWFVLAARDLSQPGAPIGPAPVLGEWRDLAYKFVLTPHDAGPDGEDLVGGMVFTKSRVPLPSAQTVRVAAGLGAMLADPRLTPPVDRDKEIVRLVPVLRFLRQLMGDDLHATLYADPLKARWGVRNALWDQRMSAEAAALALLALDECIAGLRSSPEK